MTDTPTTGLETQAAGRYIVVLKERAAPGGHAANQARAAEIARGFGLSAEKTYGSALFGFAASIPEGRLNALKRDPRVAYVEADQVVSIAAQTTPTGVRRILRTRIRTLPSTASMTNASTWTSRLSTPASTFSTAT